MSQSVHRSILTQEVIDQLAVHSPGVYLDATFGGGGHSQALLEASGPRGVVWALDRDPATKRYAKELTSHYGKRFHFRVGSYEEMASLGQDFDGILFDLGLSSDQLESSGRGFSFQKIEEPLDLRFNADAGQTAAQFLSQASLAQIGTVFREYAEDRFWRRLAGIIVSQRRSQPIRTVGDFVSIVGTDNPKVLAPLFQGLRIQINDELNTVKEGLTAAKQVVKPGGRIAVISFHSLEDRIVKDFFRSDEFESVTKKPIGPSDQEIMNNPRSRSAKLRVATKR